MKNSVLTNDLAYLLLATKKSGEKQTSLFIIGDEKKYVDKRSSLFMVGDEKKLKLDRSSKSDLDSLIQQRSQWRRRYDTQSNNTQSNGSRLIKSP